MKSHSPIMLFTLVVFSLVTSSLAWGQSAAPKPAAPKPAAPAAASSEAAGSISCSDADYAKYVSDKQRADAVLNRASRMTEDEKKASSASFTDAEDTQQTAGRNIEFCRKRIERRERACDKLLAEYNEIKKNFPVDAQIRAKVCAEVGKSDETEYTRAIVSIFATGVGDEKKLCRVSNSKSGLKDELKDEKKNFDDLEKAVREADRDLLKQQKSSQEELQSITEQRQKLKEEFENAQEEAKEAEAKALADLRDTQMKLQENLRKLQSAAITARQNVASTEIELRASISNAKIPGEEKGTINLKSDRAIVNYCRAKGKASIGGTGASRSATQGRDRRDTFQDTVKNCIETMQEHRGNIVQSFQNALEQRLQQQKEIQEQIQSTQQQFSQLTETYNSQMQQLRGRLQKAQQRYFEKDNELANAYNQALQRAQQAQFSAAQEKMRDQQKLLASLNSKGDLNQQMIDELLQKHEDMVDLEKQASALFGGSGTCEGFPGEEQINKRTQAIENAKKKASESQP